MMTTDSTKYTAAERKEQFKRKLNDQDGVRVTEPLGRSAWEVITPSGPKAAWFHYNVYFHMWTGSYNTAENITGPRELVHVFLGPRRDDFYVVSDEDLQREFTLYNQGQGSGWLLNAAEDAEKTRRNARMLDRYRGLGPLMG